jgi:hypothetical protein
LGFCFEYSIMPSLLDIFSPEDQRLLAILAILSTLSGFALWLAGIKIARFTVAIFLGLLLAAIASYQLPRDLGLSAVTSAILGFVIGSLIGAISFRILQGLVLALCLGLATGSVFYSWHAASPLAPAQVSVAAEKPEVRAQDLLIPTNHFSRQTPAASAALSSNLTDFVHKLSLRWNALSTGDQRRILVASIGVALCALLLAFTFQRPTTWITTAILGTLLLLAGLHTLAHLYAPRYEPLFPPSPLARYIALILFTSLGLLLQHKFFWPASDRPKPLAQMQTAIYQGPAMHSVLPP